MKRKMRRKNKPILAQEFIRADAILTADLHITESTPVSRMDDYMEAQRRKLNFMAKLKRRHECPIVCAGDIFDYWKSSPWLCLWALNNLPHMITIPGNHDLPMHSLAHYDKSAMALIDAMEGFHVLKDPAETINAGNGIWVTGVPFGQMESFDPNTMTDGNGKRNVLLLHELVWEKTIPTWAAQSYSGQDILERFGEYFDLIVTGDNHQSFMMERGECLLVNPGSTMRITADQENHRPCCYLYYAEANTAEPVFLPIEEGVHNRDHLDRRKEREDRVAAYIQQMDDSWELGLSFKKNLESFFRENATPRKVRDLVWGHFEGEELEK